MTEKTYNKYRNSKAWKVIERAIFKLQGDGKIDVNAPIDTVVEFLTEKLFESGLMREFIILDQPVPGHLSNDLEAIVTEGGRTTYINKIEFNEADQQLQVQFQRHPKERGKVDKTLVFNGVHNFTEYLDEPDKDEFLKDDTELLIGLDGYVSKYVIRTDCREISFYSDKQPELNR